MIAYVHSTTQESDRPSAAGPDFPWLHWRKNKVVTGKVTDARDGTPLQGATVSAKGNRSGTQTDAKGVFSLTVDNSVSAIVISSVGFNAQEISLDGKTSVEVAMAINNTSLGEVVVIGYGTARRKDLTGSVSTASPKILTKDR